MMDSSQTHTCSIEGMRNTISIERNHFSIITWKKSLHLRFQRDNNEIWQGAFTAEVTQAMFVGAALWFMNANVFIAKVAIIMKLHWVLQLFEELVYGGHRPWETVWSDEMQIDESEEICQSSSRELVSHCKSNYEQQTHSERTLCPSIQQILTLGFSPFLITTLLRFFITGLVNCTFISYLKCFFSSLIFFFPRVRVHFIVICKYLFVIALTE